MVSFFCETCAETIPKKKTDAHRGRCHALYTCLDCSTTFQGNDYKQHTQCISEDQKYQKGLYKGKKGASQQQKQQQQQQKPGDKKEQKTEVKTDVNNDQKEKEKKDKKEKKEKKELKSKSSPIASLVSDKPISIYKVIKQLTKDKHNSEFYSNKKELLKSIELVKGADGNIVIKMDK